MTLEDRLKALEALGTERMRRQDRRHGARDEQHRVRLGDIRNLAKSTKAGADPALEVRLTMEAA